MGLLQAIELVEDRTTKVPAAAATAMAMEAARDQGLLLGKGGMYGNVLRFSPPMNIGRVDVDNFCGMLDKALATVGAVTAGGVR
jgi:4-aminobutyrate aminotransferase-like enzyme